MGWIVKRLNEVLPKLEKEYEKATGKKLEFEYGAKAIACNFTKSLFAQGRRRSERITEFIRRMELGGQGIAVEYASGAKFWQKQFMAV